MADFAAEDGPYVSQRWRIVCRGDQGLLNPFFWLAERLAGSTEALLDILLKRSQQSDGWMISDLIVAAESEISRRLRDATECRDETATELLSHIREEFYQGVNIAHGSQGKLWALLREEWCLLPDPGYRPHSAGKFFGRSISSAETKPPAVHIDDPVAPLVLEQESDIGSLKAGRRSLIRAYKAACKTAGEHTDYEKIATGACKRWKCRTQIDKWLQCDTRYNGEPDRLIRDFLMGEIKRLGAPGPTL